MDAPSKWARSAAMLSSHCGLLHGPSTATVDLLIMVGVVGRGRRSGWCGLGTGLLGAIATMPARW